LRESLSNCRSTAAASQTVVPTTTAIPVGTPKGKPSATPDYDDNDEERWRPNTAPQQPKPQARSAPGQNKPQPDVGTPDTFWRTNTPAGPNERQEPLRAKDGVTALAGQVLAINGRPLEGVTLQIGTKTARTDRQGRFLLQPLQAGLQTLTIDGRSANQGQRQYGVFVSGIDLVAGKTTILPHTIWLVPLDTKHTVTFDAPTKEEIVLTTPAIPGLEVRIPAGSIVKDQQGRVVTELGITAIPLDKSSFPLPLGQTIPPIFFTVQVGGGGAIAALSPGARIIYPNYTALAPGTRADFRQYEPGVHGWEVYG